METKNPLTPAIYLALSSCFLGAILFTSNHPANAGSQLVTLQQTSSELTSTTTPTATMTLLAGAQSTTLPALPAMVTETITATVNITPTITVTPTTTVTATITPSPTSTPTVTPSATPNPYQFLPLIMKYPTPRPSIPPETTLFCDALSSPMGIPDNYPYGAVDTIYVSDPRLIYDLDVSLYIDHSWVGDLAVSLTHVETGKTISLLDRPGIPDSDKGCGSDDIATILDDEISSAAEYKCASSPAAISGIYQANSWLNAFDLESMAGTWQLTVSDHEQHDTGRLTGWCLVGKISEAPPSPTPIAPPPQLPPDIRLNGVTGQHQLYPLDCEIRSAVDWAAYFGVHINEPTFFNQLPHSDNPDKGFVGNVFGTWGQIPPHDYGIHAEPVASLLRQYGLQAYAHRPLSWDALKAEIAAGRPVEVWIIGSVYNGIPVVYTPSDGLDTVVARYEHTVVVTGYSQNRVYFLNGDSIYSKTIAEFLDSWSALGNMAITALP